MASVPLLRRPPFASMPSGTPGCQCPLSPGSLSLWGRTAVVTLLLITASASGVQSQNIRVGVRAGPTFGFLNDSAVPFVSAGGEASANTNVRLDLHAGAFLVVPISDHIAVQPELLFVQKGGHFSRSTAQRYTSERYRLSYLQGQLLGRHDFSLSGPLSLHFVGGVTMSRAVGGRVRRTVRIQALALKERIPLLKTDLIRRWDAGLLIGTTISYSTKEGHRVALGVRYNPGLRSVFSSTERSSEAKIAGLEDPPPLTRTPPPLRHDVITASLSYTRPLGW